ncbi:MAG: prephenate dehydratase [Candidatus Gastranaerophilales bacterium]|nr:prephenate dehydratase [Candidatus Gastranaerophilales bacterium]
MDNFIKKILYLGPRGSYTQIAMESFKEKLGGPLKLAKSEDISSITRVIQQLDTEEGTIAVLPIENSIEGIVRETIDKLITTKSGVKIQAELTIPICHCLISKGKKEDIENIVSMPQALSQCQTYIADNFKKNINIVSANSTSAATSMLDGKDETWASIANEFCAQLYGKKVLEKNINDVKDNKTRFVLLSKEDLNIESPERTSLAFSCKNESGSLLQVLEIFYKHKLNMIYIESRPSKKVFGEYIFFVDIDRGIDEISHMLYEIQEKCEFYRLLGSYREI